MVLEWIEMKMKLENGFLAGDMDPMDRVLAFSEMFPDSRCAEVKREDRLCRGLCISSLPWLAGNGVLAGPAPLRSTLRPRTNQTHGKGAEEDQ